GQKPGERRLAGARRAPQDQRAEMPAVERPAERPTLPDQVLLADELVERARPHPSRERLGPGRGLEQRLRLRATGAGTGRWHRRQSTGDDGGRPGARTASVGLPELPELDLVAFGVVDARE